jgi:hypothetical protein
MIFSFITGIFSGKYKPLSGACPRVVASLKSAFGEWLLVLK